MNEIGGELLDELLQDCSKPEDVLGPEDLLADLISRATDAVAEEVKAWQGRPPEAVCPVLFPDALRVRIRGEGTARDKAVCLVPGIRADGTE